MNESSFLLLKAVVESSKTFRRLHPSASSYIKSLSIVTSCSLPADRSVTAVSPPFLYPFSTMNHNNFWCYQFKTQLLTVHSPAFFSWLRLISTRNQGIHGMCRERVPDQVCKLAPYCYLVSCWEFSMSWPRDLRVPRNVPRSGDDPICLSRTKALRTMFVVMCIIALC